MGWPSTLEWKGSTAVVILKSSYNGTAYVWEYGVLGRGDSNCGSQRSGRALAGSWKLLVGMLLNAF